MQRSFAGDGAGISNVTPADGSVTNAKLTQDVASLSKVTDGEMVISAGNVGIGTTAPLSKLHILSAVGAPAPRLQSPPGGTGSVAAGWDFYVGETRKGYVGVGNESVGFGAGELLLLGGTGNKTSLWAGYNRGVTVDTNGNVGIGTSGPGFKLDVAGRAHATSFLNSSDDRLKTSIAPLTNVVERIRKIRGLSFWNEKYAALGGSSNKREFGVLANEVKEVFPELVSTWRDENYLAVDYGRLTAVLLEAAKELSSEIEVLNGRIDALEKPTKELGRKSNE